MKAIDDMITHFTARGWFNAEELEALRLRGSLTTMADPGNLEGYYASLGQSFYFEITGRNMSRLWGVDVYTSDSDLGSAAVHAGVLTLGQMGIVKVTIVQPLATFAGVTRNGVTSNAWTTGWHGAFIVEKV